MSIIDDCVQFLEDLILGDFNEQQMVSAQIIGGLVSLIPVMDQVMDARDVSGCLYRINKRGGFGKATLEEKVDFGFAAFGVVPELGSAVKTVFKPLYRQRQRAKGMINGGVAMIERMLGHKKGGAVRWVRALDWAGNTQLAIVQANAALESCIAMLDYLGQSHWWVPDRLEWLARDVAPSLKAMRGKLAAPIREAAVEIRKFLEDMLGEHAAAVAMSIASGATRVPVRASSRGRSSPGQTAHVKVGGESRTAGKAGRGKTTSAIQRTAWDFYRDLDVATKGLMGEHITDHHIIDKKNWGMKWNRHDVIGAHRGSEAPGWQSEYRKINDGGIPLYLCTPSAHVLQNGIDSLWFTSRSRPTQFAVVEAKAHINPNISLYQILGEAKRAGPATGATGRKSKAGANSAARAAPGNNMRNTSEMVMQMSRQWIQDRIDKNFISIRARINRNYSRHVFLVSPEQAAEHIRVVQEIVKNGFVNKPQQAQKFADQHATHDVAREFLDDDIDQANEKYLSQGKYRRPQQIGRKKKGK